MLNNTMTMAQAFDQAAASRPEQAALVCGEERISYGQLRLQAQALAAGLHARGIRKGDKVACLLPPGMEFACLFMGLADLGAVIIPLNPALRLRSLGQVLENARPRAIVCHEEESELPASLEGTERISTSQLRQMTTAGGSLQAKQVEVVPTDLLALLYTSGTTGQPRGTMHSHRSLIAPIVATLKVRELWLKRPSLKTIGETAKALARYKMRLLRAAGRPQVFLSTVGWHTISGVEVMLQGLLMGDTIIVMPRFHPRHALELVEKEKVSVLVAIPTALQAMLAVEGFERYDTSSLLICGTGAMPCPPELARRIQVQFGCAIHIGFGATETAGSISVSSISDSDEQQAGTVGRALPGVEIRIVDEAHHPLPAGQTGELACRGDSVMMGYYDSAGVAAGGKDADGWYYTGDLAVMDEKGYLRIVGRKSEMIIRGGQNINPVEVETYLTTHPKVRECAVVGMPSAVGGEEAWAFIIPRQGENLLAREVLDYCRAALEPYKIPARVRFVEEFPRSETGKPQKFKLRMDAIGVKESKGE